MSYTEYDKMVERFERLKTEKFYPSAEEMKQIEKIYLQSSVKEKRMMLRYLCYLEDNTTPPETDEEKEGKRALSKFLIRNLALKE